MGSRQLRFHTLTLLRLTGGTCHLEGPATWGDLPPGGTYFSPFSHFSNHRQDGGMMGLRSSVSVTVSVTGARSVHPGPVDARGPSAGAKEALRDEHPGFYWLLKTMAEEQGKSENSYLCEREMHSGPDTGRGDGSGGARRKPPGPQAAVCWAARGAQPQSKAKALPGEVW